MKSAFRSINAWLVIGVGLLLTGSASAVVTLMDPSTNNGSFEDVINDGVNATGGNIIGNGSGAFAAGQRYANTSTTPITIPGWTLTKAGSSFGGTNFSGSTPSNEGFTNVVTNGSAINAISDPIAISVPGTATFLYAGNFHQSQGSGGRYSFSVLFSDGFEQIIAAGNLLTNPAIQNTTDATIAYQDLELSSFTYTGAATSVQVKFSIDGGTNQGLADNFGLAQVPEPSVAVLGLLGVLGLAARRRR